MTDINQKLGFDASDALAELAKLDQALERGTQSLTQFANAAASVNQSSTAFVRAGRQGSAAFADLERSGKRSADSLRNSWEGLISVHGRYTTSLALAARITFTQGVLTAWRLVKVAIVDSTQAAMDFQKQLAEIRSIDSDKIFGADLGDKLRGISSEFGLALPDVSTGAYEALSAQVLKTAKDVRFLEAAAALSKGTLSSMESSVKGLAGGLNAYGQTVDNVDRLASQFNETVRLGTIRQEELSAGFGTVATLGRQLGASQAELLAAVATLTAAGVPQAQAFTQIRASLVGLAKPTDAMTKLFRENGIASGEQLIAMRGYGGAMKFLLEQTDGTTAGTAELFANQRALLGVLSLGGQNFNTYSANVQTLNGVTNQLNKDRAQEIMATDAEKLSKRVNQLQNDLIPVGNALITVANKSLQTHEALSQLTVATGDFIGDLIRGQPALDQFSNAYRSFQELFGKDITIGDSGGKIVSFLEIRQRQLDTFSKRREEDAAKQLKELSEHNAAINKLRFKEVDNFKASNLTLQTEAKSAADNLIKIEKDKLAALKRQIDAAKNLVSSSATSVSDLKTKQVALETEGQSNDLPAPQQALALIQQSQTLASQARQQLEAAARSGSLAAADRARSLFASAEAAGKEARSVADAAGARDRAGQASRSLLDITKAQISAEETASRIAASRIPTLEQQRAKQQATLDIMTKATQSLVANSSLFDKQGNQVSGDEAAKRAEARARALKTLVEQGVPNEKIIELQFLTEGSLQTLAQQLQAKLNTIDATPFQIAETAMQGTVISSGAIADNWERSAAAAAKLNSAQVVPPGPTKTNAMGYLKYARTGFNRGTDTIPVMAARGESMINARSTNRFFSQLQAINAGVQPVYRQSGGPVTNIGDVNVNIRTSDPSQINGRSLGRSIKRELRRRTLRF